MSIHQEAFQMAHKLRLAAVETARAWDAEDTRFYANRLFTAATMFKAMEREAMKRMADEQEDTNDS